MTSINDEHITIRFAQESETGLILKFIKDLAEYEHLLDTVTATEEIVHKSIFQDKRAEVLFCDYDGETVGFAVFFHNFSTFTGKPGLYLEDLYVQPEMRHKGVGKKIMAALAAIATERDCGRFEWVCLDWNQKSIDFYLGLGAEAMTDWTIYKVNEQGLAKLANTA